mmetsp:Transcript_47289/g.92244  ORF Transcript_47289/g.92244 Transcript_47289/m.92244 type:complete len:217 (+) Transcript_47289:699-1349(+)
MTPPVWCFPSAWAARTLVASCPEFCARIFGTTSRAFPNARIAYWSRPGHRSPNPLIRMAVAISVAPAPGTSLPSTQHAVRTAFAPSSTARSRSLSTLCVLARSSTVETRERPPAASGAATSKTVQWRPPISWTRTERQAPVSSGVGGPRRTRALAPVARQRRRSSHLEEILTHIMPYRSMKCRAISETVPPETTTSAPESAMDLMMSSIFSSSERL